MEYSKKKCEKCFGGIIMVRVLKLRNIRIKEQKKLNENNLFLYKYITTYIKATDLTMYEKEEILHQIMDMLLVLKRLIYSSFDIVPFSIYGK